MDLHALDRHGRALADRLESNGARLREHMILWLAREGLSEIEAEAVLVHAVSKGWIAQLRGTQVIFAGPASLRG